MTGLTHLDGEGRARMVDVGGKPVERRIARADGHISLSPGTVQLLRENGLHKGDALTVAQIAGISAAKRTGELIPLCHPLALDHVAVELAVLDGGVAVTAEVRCLGRTGVEMEALTAVSMALLTVYDMCKSVDKTMVIDRVRLIEKRKEDPAVPAGS
jgi:cyclic pyranopterin monophosphate synthase